MDLFFVYTIKISNLLQPLEPAILKEFILATAGKSISDLDKDLFSLPVQMGGLGLCNPSTIADFDHHSPLIQDIIQQRMKCSAAVLSDQCQAKVDVSLQH